MIATVDSVLQSAIAMASLVVMLFFLRFWRQTRDSFFLLFSLAFGIDGLTRFALALVEQADPSDALYYLPRLATFCLIIVAIVRKNRPSGGLR
jgi:uncharacterized protein DUF5985